MPEEIEMLKTLFHFKQNQKSKKFLQEILFRVGGENPLLRLLALLDQVLQVDLELEPGPGQVPAHHWLLVPQPPGLLQQLVVLLLCEDRGYSAKSHCSQLTEVSSEIESLLQFVRSFRPDIKIFGKKII